MVTENSAVNCVTQTPSEQGSIYGRFLLRLEDENTSGVTRELHNRGQNIHLSIHSSTFKK